MKELPQKGVSSIKIFMAYNGSPLHVDDGSFYRILEESGKVGLTVFVHAENGEILNFLRDECVKKGQLAPKYHYVSARHLQKRRECEGQYIWHSKQEHRFT